MYNLKNTIIRKLTAILIMLCVVITMGSVKTSASRASINYAKKSLSIGKTLSLKVKGTDANITWSSNHPEIAEVNSKGKVTAKKAGNAVISASADGILLKSTITVKNSGMTVRMLDVGQGDSLLILVNSKTILMDTGADSEYSKLKYQLEYYDVSTIDALILTHPDADHIGGADNVLKDFNVLSVYMPRRMAETKEFKKLVSIAEECCLNVSYPKEGDKLDFGKNLTVTVLSVDAGDDTNSSSIVTRWNYKKNSFLFTGDAPAKVENDIMAKYDINVDVLKISHHGSDNSSPILYLKNASPEYALISCGADNTYGHPDTNVLRRLDKYAKKTLITAVSGTVTIHSDGKSLNCFTERVAESETIETKAVEAKNVESKTVETENADAKTVDTKSKSDNQSEVTKDSSTENTKDYTDSDKQAEKNNEKIIGNINSKVYHNPTCKTLPIEKNRVYFSSESEAESEGYRPCKNCH